jgi:lipopolysaccharide assembly LptE-like protein
MLLAAVFMNACVDEPVAGSRPTSTRHQLVGGAKLSIQTIANKSQQFGLENALSSTLLDEFLRDGRYQIVPVKESDDVIAVTITHYLLAPIGYDVTLAPISYKLRIAVDLTLVDRATDKPLWTEKNLEGSLTYPSPLLSGGMSEQQAQAVIWTVLSPMIVERVSQGAPAAPPAVSTAAAAELPPLTPEIR